MTNDAMKSSRFEIEELPYGYDALMPQISEETMRYHHDRHYATYVAKLNELSLDTPFAGQPLEDVVRSADGPLFNNAAQAWNHAFLFRSLSPAPQTAPDAKSGGGAACSRGARLRLVRGAPRADD